MSVPKDKIKGMEWEELKDVLPAPLRKRIALSHPLAFARTYLTHLMKEKSPRFHGDMIQKALQEDRLLFLAPRDHAKSTLFSVIYPLWRIVKNRDIRISIISDTQTQAYKFVKAVRFQLQNNDKLIEDFGNFVGENWQKSQFTVQREVHHKDPTVAGHGLNSSNLGDRADLIICDDPINSDVCLTAARRKKAKRWYFEVLTNFLEEDGGQIITIGTRQHEKDLYQVLIDKETYTAVVYKAVIDDDEGRVLWPSKWTYDKLMDRKRDIGSLAFARQFQNEITSEGSSIFPEHLLTPAMNEDGRLVNIYAEKPNWLSKYRAFMGMDLAESAETSADYIVLLTLGLDDNGNRKLLHLYRGKGLSFQEQIDKLLEVYDYFNHEKICIESNQYQAVLPDTVKEGSALPILNYQTGVEKHTEDVGVPALRIKFENGKYDFPYDESHKMTKDRVDKLLKELNSLATDEDGKIISTAAHDDTVMALWLAEIAIKDSAVKSRIKVIDRSERY